MSKRCSSNSWHDTFRTMMDNDLDSMRDLWRQFRRMLVKKVGYFDLFRKAARHELTPDWFLTRYGSVWQHAFVLIKNL